MKIKIKKLHKDAIIPHFAKPGDAGLDLYAVEDLKIEPGERGVVKTGLAVEIPNGYVGLVWDKSGISFNHGITTIAGVMDSEYRGEYLVSLINLSKETYVFEKGKKAAQLLIQPVEHPEIEEVEELSETERGEGRFGSTGV